VSMTRRDALGPITPRRTPARPVVKSEDLFREAREVLIVHRDDEYRLRITRAGKLILTK
jgi:hemin uptake protein HemP